MKRRLLAIFLSLTLMLSLVPSAWAVENEESSQEAVVEEPETELIEGLQVRINALPDADTLAEMDEDEQAEVYAEVCDIYDAIDKLTPEEAGALDVYTVPIGMKKSRPGVMLCVLCREEQREEMARLLLRHTTTLGVRESRHRRYTLSRAEETVDTPWGPVARKLSQGWGVRRQKPEYEDLARIAREQDLPLDQVRQQIR